MNKIGFLGLVVSVMLVISLGGVFAGSFSLISENDKIDIHLMEKFDDSDRVRTIVTVKPSSVSGIISMIDEVEGHNDRYIVAHLTKTEVLQLSRNKKVEKIRNVKEALPLLSDAVGIVEADLTWELHVDGVNLTGKDQVIAIVDSGIDFNHPDLQGKNALGGNAELVCLNEFEVDCVFIEEGFDTLGHGTHVAGIAVANGEINGIAKDAKLISLKVFSGSGDVATEMEMTNAVIWVMEHADEYNISVISMSIGGSQAYGSYCTGYIEDHINQLNDEFGVANTIAAGNGGRSDGVSWPSCAEKAIPVGATDKQDYRWIGSNYHDLVKVFAPGRGIVSTCRGGGSCIKSGTSMATPMVAGAIAIMNQQLELSDHGARTLNPKEEIEPMLFRNAEEILNLDFDKWRRLNVYNVIIEMLLDQCTGDLNDDGVVDVADINIVLGDWGCDGDCEGDVNGDGVVDVADIIDLLRGWGSCVSESEYAGDKPSLEELGIMENYINQN